MSDPEDKTAATDPVATEPAAAGQPVRRKKRRRRRRSGHRRPQTGPVSAQPGVPGAPTGEPVQPPADDAEVPAAVAEQAEFQPSAEEIPPAPEPQAAAAAGIQKKRRRRRGGRRHRRRTGAGAGEISAGQTAAPGNLAAPAPAAVAVSEPTGESREAAVSPAGEPGVNTGGLPASGSGGPAAPPAAECVDAAPTRGNTPAYHGLKFPDVDAERARRIISDFFHQQNRDSGINLAVLGLSGDLNSAVVAALAVQALGSQKVALYFCLEAEPQNPAERERAAALAAHLRCALEILDLRPQLETVLGRIQASEIQRRRLRRGQVRLAALADIAYASGAWLAASTNKSQRLLGESSLEDPGVPVLCPLGDLYHSQVAQLARGLRFPGPVNAGFEEAGRAAPIGLTPAETDLLLYQIVDIKLSLARLLELGLGEEKIRRLYRQLKAAAVRGSQPAWPEAVSAYAPKIWAPETSRRA